MLTVGALTLVTPASRSYAVGGFAAGAVGGFAAGAVGVGPALGAPVLGFLADRLGQRPVLVLAALLDTLAIALVIGATYSVPGFSGKRPRARAGLCVLYGVYLPADRPAGPCSLDGVDQGQARRRS